jgi:hypothetical protein
LISSTQLPRRAVVFASVLTGHWALQWSHFQASLLRRHITSIHNTDAGHFGATSAEFAQFLRDSVNQRLKGCVSALRPCWPHPYGRVRHTLTATNCVLRPNSSPPYGHQLGVTAVFVTPLRPPIGGYGRIRHPLTAANWGFTAGFITPLRPPIGGYGRVSHALTAANWGETRVDPFLAHATAKNSRRDLSSWERVYARAIP